MDLQRGILFLYDPEHGKGLLPRPERTSRDDVRSVRYTDAAQCLSDAQNMLYALHTGIRHTCIVSEGRTCCIALALAAQLTVDRIVLCGPDIFAAQIGGGDRTLRRIEGFAVRNMPLIAAEIILIDVDRAQIRMLIRMLGSYARRNVKIADSAESRQQDGFGGEMTAGNINEYI